MYLTIGFLKETSGAFFILPMFGENILDLLKRKVVPKTAKRGPSEEGKQIGRCKAD